MAQQNGNALQQQSGDTGVDFGGDPGDQTFLMNRKVAKAAGSPTALIDRDFQRLQRQTPRTLAQNTPTRAPSISGILQSAGRQRRGRKKF